MSDNAEGSTCPHCGAVGAQPSEMDSWWCPSCSKEFPTRAFKCRRDECWEFVFIGQFCERHR